MFFFFFHSRQRCFLKKQWGSLLPKQCIPLFGSFFCDLNIYYFFFCFFKLMAICIFTCWRFPHQSFYFCYIFALLFLTCLGYIIMLTWPLISFLKSTLFFLSQSVNPYWRGGKSFPQSSYGPWLGLKIKLKTDWKEKSMQIYLTSTSCDREDFIRKWRPKRSWTWVFLC